MSGKKVSFGMKPSAQKSAEEWVSEPTRPRGSEQPSAVMKRLTIDVPEDLHRRLKIKAASEGVRMADLVREWISDHCSS